MTKYRRGLGKEKGKGYKNIIPKNPKVIGWDRNIQIYRHLARGEKTRGMIIKNPKKLTNSQLKRLYIKRQKLR